MILLSHFFHYYSFYQKLLPNLSSEKMKEKKKDCLMVIEMSACYLQNTRWRRGYRLDSGDFTHLLEAD